LIAFFFDIEKAFDKVWHKAILAKMISMGIPIYLINWIKAFLSNRSFKVKVNGQYSSEYPILAGVPQGSAISPLLFSIFINDMPINNKINIAYSLLFADDLVSLFCFDKEGKLKSMVEKYLKSIENWVNKWRLKMAANKCSYTVFASKTYHLNLKPKLFGVDIPNDKNPKFLGVKFDERLTFSQHIAEIKIKCLKRLNLIKIISHKSWHLNFETLKTIYQALVRSLMEYSAFISVIISKANLAHLQSIQNRAIKAIFRPPLNTNLVNFGRSVGLQPVTERLGELFEAFLKKSLSNANPIVHQMAIEYRGGFEGRDSSRPTLCCHLRDYIFDVLRANPN
jgi:hypothetical protein